MIVTFWKGVFVADTLEEPGALKRAGFELHEPSMCQLKTDVVCRACRAKIGRRWWTSHVEAATRLKQFCNDRALGVMKNHLEMLRKSRATDANINVPAPPGLSFMPFQKAGVAYMLQRTGTLVADEMGLGKTPESLGFLNCIKPKNTIVVCPATLIFNWRNEAEKWLTGFDYDLAIVESKSDSLPDRDDLVVIVNYEKLTEGSRILGELRARDWDVGIFDEAQYIKNPEAARSLAVLGPGGVAHRCRRQLFLTGTPIENYPKEIWAIAAFLNPARFGNRFDFERRYCSAHYEDRKFVDPKTNNVRTKSVWVATGASNLGELQQRLRASCLTGDALISTEHGPVTIREIVEKRLQVRVWSRDPLGRLSLKPVVGFSVKEHRELLVQIRHAEGELTCTPEHRIHAEQGWKRADACAPGDRLLTMPAEGRTTPRREQTPDVEIPVDVFDELRRQGSDAAKKNRLRGEESVRTSIADEELPGVREHLRREEQEDLQGQKILHVQLPREVHVQARPRQEDDEPGGAPKEQRESSWEEEGTAPAPDKRQQIAGGERKKISIQSPAMEGNADRRTKETYPTVDAVSARQVDPQSRPGTHENVAGARLRPERLRRSPRDGSRIPVRRHPGPGHEIRDRNRRGRTRSEKHEEQGPSTGLGTRQSRILSVETLAVGRRGEVRGIARDSTLVYDIEVADNHNFFANGVLVHNCMIRRLKRDVLKELPPKRRQLIVLHDSKKDWSKDPRFQRWQAVYEKQYEAAEARLEAAETEEAYRDAAKSLEEVTGIAFTEMSTVRHEVALAKLPMCIKYVDEVLAAGTERLVLFAHHRDVVDALREKYAADSVVVHGGTPQTGPWSREAAVKTFQEGKKKIFIGQTRAAGVGLTLTAADTVIFVEVDWVPGVVTQCEDRLCRIGQKKMVHVIHLVLGGTMEVNMIQRLIRKQDIIDKALDKMPELKLRKGAK